MERKNNRALFSNELECLKLVSEYPKHSIGLVEKLDWWDHSECYMIAIVTDYANGLNIEDFIKYRKRIGKPISEVEA
jgi:hypothetical protein